MKDIFSLKGKVAIITGGAGLLGIKHAEIIAEYGGIPILLDIDSTRARSVAEGISADYDIQAIGVGVDITVKPELENIAKELHAKYGRIDILINNAANNPKVENNDLTWSRFENFSQDNWNRDILVGLTGAFLCSQVFGSVMAKQGKGVILNIASDLAIIAPDQRIYREEGLPEDKQPVKPVTYSVVKSGLIGLTRYLATYWAEKGVRVNALVPGGVENDQPESFVRKLNNLIPLGRMAQPDEYKGAVLFLISEASSYMTGNSLVIDGGRTCW